MIIVFDVDGTLLDTYPVVRQTYIDIFDHYLPTVAYDEALLASFFGPPLYDTFYQLVNNVDQANVLVQRYRQQTKINNPQYLKVFPGAKECIEKLSRKGFILGVLSNKIKEAIIDGFDLVGFPNRFDLILGYEDLKHPKPDPEGLLKMKAMFHDEVVMVGDSIYDMEVARRAGSESIGVTWGNTSRTQLCDAGATWIASSFEELLQILSSYSPL